jgi:hypothetical protein
VRLADSFPCVAIFICAWAGNKKTRDRSARNRQTVTCCTPLNAAGPAALFSSPSRREEKKMFRLLASCLLWLAQETGFVSSWNQLKKVPVFSLPKRQTWRVRSSSAMRA